MKLTKKAIKTIKKELKETSRQSWEHGDSLREKKKEYEALNTMGFALGIDYALGLLKEIEL